MNIHIHMTAWQSAFIFVFVAVKSYFNLFWLLTFVRGIWAACSCSGKYCILFYLCKKRRANLCGKLVRSALPPIFPHFPLVTPVAVWFDLNPTHSEFGEFCVDLHSTHSPQVQLCSSLGSKCKCKYNYIRNPFSGISVCFSYIFQFVSRNCANLWFAVRRRIFEIWVDVTYPKPYYAKNSQCNTIIVIRYISYLNLYDYYLILNYLSCLISNMYKSEWKC